MSKKPKKETKDRKKGLEVADNIDGVCTVGTGVISIVSGIVILYKFFVGGEK